MALNSAARRRFREHQGPTCLRCGASERLTIDHVIPLSRGGGSAATNLQTLCADCNAWKASQPHDYRHADLPSRPGVKRDNEAYRRGSALLQAFRATQRRPNIVWVSEAEEPLDGAGLEEHHPGATFAGQQREE